MTLLYLMNYCVFCCVCDGQILPNIPSASFSEVGRAQLNYYLAHPGCSASDVERYLTKKFAEYV